jgi:hypothetical protein
MKKRNLIIYATGFLLLLICDSPVFSQEVVINNGAIIDLAKTGALSFSNGTDFTINSQRCVFDGTIEFKGSKEQNLYGKGDKISFSNLVINNSNLVNLYHDAEIQNKLKLMSGVLNLLDHDLVIKENAAIEGNFSETSMIAADSKGRLWREIAGVGTYYFPVGDLTDLADFSPVTVEFKSGKFNKPASLSVNLRNYKHPKNMSKDNYLNRFWSLNQKGIQNFSCDVSLEYVNLDIVGAESCIYGALWNNNKWTMLDRASANSIKGKVCNFSDFTGVDKYSNPASKLKLADIDIIVTRNGISLFSEESVQLKKIEIFNKVGQMSYSKKLDSEVNPDLPLHLVSDLYLIKITTDKNVISKKVFIP